MLRIYLATFVQVFTQIMIFAIFARVVLSWMRVAPHGFLLNFLMQVTEPLLGFFRRLLPPLGGVLDLSPLFAFFALDIARTLLLRILG